MSEKDIERVAKAMHEKQIPGITLVGEWTAHMPIYREKMSELARAAILAMREPTPEMVLVGYEMLDNEVTPHAAEACWYAMVDEMLK